jgi:hypothetical protein
VNWKSSSTYVPVTKLNYQCSCLPGYSGTNCSIINAGCQHSPCVNGGTCVTTNCLRDVDDGHYEWTSPSLYRYSNNDTTSFSLLNVDFSYCFWFYRTRTSDSDIILSHGSVLVADGALHTGVRGTGNPSFVSDHLHISVEFVNRLLIDIEYYGYISYFCDFCVCTCFFYL